MKYRTDIELWRSIKNGDVATFEYVYHTYYKDLYYYGLKLSNEANVTEDCIHDLFVQIWSNKTTINEVHSIKPYLIKCFRRRLLTMLTQDLHTVDYEKISLRDEYRHQSAEDTLISIESKSETKAKLSSVMDKLTRRQREAIHLKFFMGFDYDEICTVMNLQYQTVRNLICESIKVMRIILEQPVKTKYQL